MSIIPGKRVRRTRWVHTPHLVVAVEVDAVLPDADPTDWVFEPAAVELLREVERHAHAGDLDWLSRHGKVYQALSPAV